MTVHHPIRFTPATWSKWESRLMTGILCWRAMARSRRISSTASPHESAAWLQLVLQRFGDVVLEKHALPCGSGFHFAKQGIGAFNGRAHKSLFPFFHDPGSSE
jgi:hypothetical protein